MYAAPFFFNSPNTGGPPATVQKREIWSYLSQQWGPGGPAKRRGDLETNQRERCKGGLFL
jgi:hypothetical protein